MKLWVIRHAKSSWADHGQADLERPLNKRGNADGPRMAHWLATQAEPATWIWSSDAARALATAEFVATIVAKQPGRARPWTHRSRVRLHLRKSAEDGTWLVQEAEYNIPASVLRSLRMAD